MTDAFDGADRIDTDARSYRYYRNAVERHWDPTDVDLQQDRVRVAALDDDTFDQLRGTLALFGAGEEAVTEDLAPLGVVLSDLNDQLFVTTQLYEEAKHADFFQRYWSTVIAREEDSRGQTRTNPRDPKWYSDAYVELFERTEAAMHRLLTEDTPQTRAEAYCHYHLTIEGILAQTGYYGIQTSFDGSVPGVPELPGLVEGFGNIRADEGRHVGFGMAKLEELVESGAVEAEALHELTAELAMLTQEAVSEAATDGQTGVDPDELAEYAATKHAERMTQITDDDVEIPDVEELVDIGTD
ncbi:ribonucleotide-diphosphate reductase subunit beta [Haloarchaeobius iranensis]|uniref:Ribonucleoside-diphosphate reductase beta chain n=1 Tax=Haloarchaeobius iranensis TaxID=996166 RepID=A0A1G9XE81_9EURY|nr:ribonucleotide-diphosphate reductase subunit beta [Haloarchaeobius iranensis]SDM94585.1 ribonucleoside-diphosphate reductase beta chain [Haloarchaeobius iranensis]